MEKKGNFMSQKVTIIFINNFSLKSIKLYEMILDLKGY